MGNDSVRVPYDEVVPLLTEILQQEGMSEERAKRCARLFADASRDGVPSHGLNRFGLFLKWIRAGTLLVNAPLTRISGLGGLERWDGGFGPGPWNAWNSMARAIELSKTHGIGCVALRRTNHWMRAGNYGWQAADAGCIGICWTNGIALMPPYGGKGRRIGNNPLVIAVPRHAVANGQSAPEHVVLDMAVSQYSMGKLGLFRNAGQMAPLPAGYDAQGNETRDPDAIMRGGTAMPIGYWKGSGLGMVLDIVAAVTSGGQATHDIRADNNEQGVSQMFIALEPAALGSTEEMQRIVQGVLADIKASGEKVLYPGERSFATRRESTQLGIPVQKNIWDAILAQKK